jgi:fermentation-respiration switch protein FrsA (DUF1100 family)
MLDQLFIYHPMPWSEQDWARASGLPLEDVWFRAADGTRLFGWYVQASAQAPVVLWCHGNAGNITHRLRNLTRLVRLGLSVFLFDYRGYGRSQGQPSETGLYQDAGAAYSYLTNVRKTLPKRVIVFGRSLGSTVAGHLVSERPAAGLILESSFPSVEHMARTHYFGLPAHWLLRARFDLASHLKRVRVPLLIIHGDRDRIVPIGLGRKVYEQANGPKDFYRVSGAGHNDVTMVGGRPYFQRIIQFITRVTYS